MEIVLIVIALVVIGALIYFNSGSKTLDVNKDGKVDAADVKAAVETLTEVVAPKVEKVVEKAKRTAKTATTKAKATVKKVEKATKTVAKKAPAKTTTRAKKETKTK
jgi:hypothetical protein